MIDKFEAFKQAFEEKYPKEGYGGYIYDFIDEVECGKEIPFGGSITLNNDDVSYDSYGNEDTRLERIFFFEEFGIHVSFFGRRQSYNGTDWDGYKQVTPVEKTITVYE